MANKLLRKIGMGMTVIMTLSQINGVTALAAPEENGNGEFISIEDDEETATEFEDLECTTASSANSGTCGENVKWSISNNVLTISGSGDMADYSGSQTSPFYQNRKITSIIIEDGVTSVGKDAFLFCENVKNVSLPDSLTKISESGFQGCTSLSSVDIPDNVTYIGVSAFSNCWALISVDFPSNLEVIERSAFAFCYGVTVLHLPKSLKRIGEWAFDSIKMTDVYYEGSESDWSKVEIVGENYEISYRATIHYGSSNSSSNPVASGVSLKKEGDTFVCYVDGKCSDTYTGYADYESSKFYVENGKLNSNINGVQIDPNSDPLVWYFCANGQVQAQHVGLAEYDGEWFYVENGKVAVDMNKFVNYDGGLFAVAVGRIVSEYSGLMQDPENPQTGDWYFFANGQAQTQYTGLAMYDGEWFYIVKGKLATDYTGNVDYDGSVFYVENGMVK